MNSKLCRKLTLLLSLSTPCLFAQPYANRNLNNLSVTSINVDLSPQKANLLSLGNEKFRWKNIFLQNISFANGTVQSTAFVPYTAGTGISISRGAIVNTAPDRLITISGGEGIVIGGRYPNFTIGVANANNLWSTNGTSIFCNSGNIGIGTDNPTAKFEVNGGDAIINGLTIGRGNGSGASNIAIGLAALYNNVAGFSNTAFGNQTMYSNLGGYDNSAFGENALYSNTEGVQNTALGNGTLYYNISGVGNTAVGTGALLNNGVVQNQVQQDASYNVANGFLSLANNSSGSMNTALGTGGMSTNTTGNYNTTVGAYSDMATEDLYNAAAFGANALVNANNKIRLGDVNVDVIESSSGSWTTSDGRFKTNIRETVAGLGFIKLLRPVVYNFEAAKFDAFLSQRLPDSIKAKRSKLMKLHAGKQQASKVETGLIAQEVAAAAKQAGYEFNGVHAPENAYDNYSISYEKLVVPLIKSVQELAQQNESLQQQLLEMKQQLDKLNGSGSTQTVTVTGKSLQQNVPNPFNSSTVIGYQLPTSTQRAELRILDAAGKTIQQIKLLGNGKGTVQVNAAQLAAGSYQYQLWINGMASESKQMYIVK